MTNQKIADIFARVADLLEFQGANTFRLRAYRNGARAIRDLPESVSSILVDETRSLTEIDGIGKDLAAKCETLVETGELPMLNELLEQIPESVLKILRVPGLGPKKAAILYNEMNIENLEQLEAACREERVRELKGFGAKTEQTILQGIQIAAAADDRTYWAEADLIVQQLLRHMESCQAIHRMEMAGSYRRGKETVGDLDLLVDSDDADAVMDHFGKFTPIVETLVRGATKMSVRVDTEMQIDLRVVPSRSFGAALQYFTGSKEHNVILRGMARSRGLKINEWGVYRVEDDEFLAGASEEEVYAALGLPLFPPEIREARQEYDLAEKGQLPVLVNQRDIRGDLHMHTTATDGKATLREMVEAAKSRGLKYIAITDHSKRVSMANGLDEKRLRQQWAEVDMLNQELGNSFTVLKGVECDILEAGGMDLQDDVLAEADWVLASVHYGQKQPRKHITERILGALENPHITAIAHPTGRIINKRDPYDVDLDQVFAAAKEHGKLLELNANPARLDLNDTLCATAKSFGIPIVVSTDAHSVEGLDVLRYGILQARRGGLTKKDVANTRTWSQLKKLIRR